MRDVTPRRRLRLAGLILLMAGLLGMATCLLPANEPDDAATYALTDSKRARHTLERFGGKAAVLMDDFNRWFAGLWQGRQLFCTLGVLVVGIAWVCFRVARHL
ncbi:MAG: hypothetical protein HQL66_14625 [Magnetococcales bacterium]|nr:hypothetical protein [Magnetococcales bacterium]